MTWNEPLQMRAQVHLELLPRLQLAPAFALADMAAVWLHQTNLAVAVAVVLALQLGQQLLHPQCKYSKYVPASSWHDALWASLTSPTLAPVYAFLLWPLALALLALGFLTVVWA